jgi:cholesterol oxidase
MNYDYDFIIIGSGFGGSVSALRLSEKGYKVLVIEKGKWYKATDFPKTNWNLRKWLWMPGFHFFGIMKMSIFKHIVILSGTGVGGGSLVYANTLPIPKEAFYKTGSWANLIDWKKDLAPFYKKALNMLGATKNPRLFDGDIVLKKLAKEINREDGFEHPMVAVHFGEENIETKDPYFKGKGPSRKGCTFCGACMTGCRHNAKNSLDKNYLYLAKKNGVEILAQNEVIDVKTIRSKKGQGYLVTVKTIGKLFNKRKDFSCESVIFSGGVLGTIKLLLRIKDKSLPYLSDKLGEDIRTNNETLVSVSTLQKDKDFSKGVAIGSLLHTDDNSHLEVVRYGAGSGFWKLLHLPYATGNNVFNRLVKMMGRFLSNPFAYFRIYFLKSWSKSTTVLLFMQSLDSTLRFKRGLLGNLTSKISKGKKPSAYIPESIALTEKYAHLSKGKATSFVLESLAGIPSTAHILGGAVMGADKNQGVIDKDNKVFGYNNMYIIDGSMISANPGVNPALSITAIAERAISKIADKKLIF